LPTSVGWLLPTWLASGAFLGWARRMPPSHARVASTPPTSLWSIGSHTVLWEIDEHHMIVIAHYEDGTRISCDRLDLAGLFSNGSWPTPVAPAGV